MRFYHQLRVPSRLPQQEPVPFQEILPLRLKATVSGKGERSSKVACIHEMSVLFACFKNNDFNEALCSKEINAFQSCYKDSVVKKQLKKSQEQKGILVPGDKNLSFKQKFEDQLETDSSVTLEHSCDGRDEEQFTECRNNNASQNRGEESEQSEYEPFKCRCIVL